MVLQTGMLRQHLTLCAALGAVACAQIAGFKDLSPRQDEPANGGSGGTSAGRGGASMNAGSGNVSGSDTDEAAAGESSGGAPVPGGGGRGVDGNVAGSATTGGAPSAGASSNAGTNATAGSGGSVDDEVVGGCNAEQLKNGSFDRGAAAAGWQLDPMSTALGITETSDVILEKQSSRLLKAGVAPQSGNYLSWLGSAAAEEPAHVTFFQLVTVPDKVTRLVLRGYIR
ncbi:MAG TPA: hypothetical protein VEQ59_02640, partial [Polyangiaceae bacterium]|nr:hypothetical protein [Polyangiaceae bacterium]